MKKAKAEKLIVRIKFGDQIQVLELSPEEAKEFIKLIAENSELNKISDITH